MRKLLVLSALAACGGKPAPVSIPMLPGDGDSHVVKPPPPPPKTVSTDPWAGRTDLLPPPSVRAPAALELPKIDELKLSNGLTVYIIKSDRLPVVAMQLAVRAGRMNEPRARLGVSELAADMLVKGTQRRDAAALAKAIDFVGGTIAADSTFEATLVSCSVLARNANVCLELVPEMVMQPAFPEVELTKLRGALVATLRQRLDDASTLASAHAQNLLWGNDHVRGWINSEQSISSIRRDDLVAWHRQWFVPGNAMLVIAGDVDPKKLRGDLERTFGAWRKGPVPPAPTYPEQGLSGSRIRLVDKPGQTVTQLRIAQFGIKHDDSRFFDTLVWNAVLGGGPGSRLARAVREGGTPALGASSSFDRNIDRGSFVASSATRNADAVATVKRMLAEIAKLASEGPSRDEVGAAIVNLTGTYAMRYQSAADLGAGLVGAELHGFGREYLTNFPVVLGNVEVADAKRAAAEILDPKAYVVVMVGDAKDLEPQLKKEGWRYEKVAFTEPVTASAAAPPVAADPAAIAAAHKLIDEALAAKGGKARLAAVKAIQLTAAGTTVVQGQSVPVEISRVLVLPDKMRIDATIAKQLKVTVAVDGKTGWEIAPDPSQGGKPGLIDLKDNDMAAAQFEAWREVELILLKASDPAAKLTPLPDEKLGERQHSVIQLASPFGNLAVTLYIDQRSKLISRMSYTDSGQTEIDDFTDYKDVNGIKVAHKRTSQTAGRNTTLTLDKVEFDSKIDPGLFKKPAGP